MRVQPGIRDPMHAVHLVRHRGCNDKEIVGLEIARYRSWCANDSSYFLNPPRSSKVSWGAVLVATDYPGPTSLAKVKATDSNVSRLHFALTPTWLKRYREPKCTPPLPVATARLMVNRPGGTR